MKKRYQALRYALLSLTAMALIAMTSCKKDDNEITGTASMYVPAVAVTKFYLKHDNKVMNHLDSVFFSIDLDNGVIFNADSLPKGTPIGSLIPMITFSSTVTEATIEMEGGSHRSGVTDYRRNPGDSIDFTGNVTLTLKSDDISRSYRLKVNVHKADPDSLCWGETAYADLPSRMETPRRQKTVSDGNNVYCLLEEKDGSHTLASTSDIFGLAWDRRHVNLPTDVRIETFTLSGGKFYILYGDGSLMMADTETLNWESTGERWVNIDGDYEGHILGIALKDGVMTHTHYPAAGNISVTPVAAGFPVREHSRMHSISNSWSAQPTVFIFGGVTADGEPTNAVWAFDGENWADINNGTLPPLANATVVSYYNYRKTSTSWIQNEYQVWLIFGGRNTDGTINRTVYISYDNGVNWKKADQYLQLPSYIPGTQGADCIVGFSDMQTDLADSWTRAGNPMKAMAKLPYNVDGYEISWKCPYLFIIGGYDAEGALNNGIWRGVLERLRFTPLI